MAKLNRERLLRERRLHKQAKKDERKRRAAEPPVAPSETNETNEIEPPTHIE